MMWMIVTPAFHAHLAEQYFILYLIYCYVALYCILINSYVNIINNGSTYNTNGNLSSLPK